MKNRVVKHFITDTTLVAYMYIMLILFFMLPIIGIIVGAIVGAIWGWLVLISSLLLTLYFSVYFWRNLEAKKRVSDG